MKGGGGRRNGMPYSKEKAVLYRFWDNCEARLCTWESTEKEKPVGRTAGGGGNGALAEGGGGGGSEPTTAAELSAGCGAAVGHGRQPVRSSVKVVGSAEGNKKTKIASSSIQMEEASSLSLSQMFESGGFVLSPHPSFPDPPLLRPYSTTELKGRERSAL